jgi:MHS family proline/betaine transporter-like MFS transporter
MTANSAGKQTSAIRVIAAVSIGNALEWFDFVVYGFLAVTMAKLFFPTSDPLTSLLLTFGTFGIPFLVRPLGAVVVGAYADRRGRKAALLLTIALMMIGTLMMAVVPTYASIGPWAAITVIVARILQGFSVGGEYGAATALLIEQNPGQRGFLASWQYTSQSMTTIMATGFAVGLNTALTQAQIESWGWRIPFLFGLLLGPVAFYIRSGINETREFNAAKPLKAPIRELFARQKARLALGVGVIAVSSVTVYTILFLPTFAIKQLGLPPAAAYAGGLLTGAVQLLVIPAIGWLSDRYGRAIFALVASFALLLLVYPMFAWMVAVPALSTLLLVQGLLGLLNAINLGCLGGLLSDLFPTMVRSSGLSLANALAQTIFGGFAPFINLWLINVTGNPLAPSFSPMFGAIVSIAALIGLRRSAALSGA